MPTKGTISTLSLRAYDPPPCLEAHLKPDINLTGAALRVRLWTSAFFLDNTRINLPAVSSHLPIAGILYSQLFHLYLVELDTRH